MRISSGILALLLAASAAAAQSLQPPVVIAENAGQPWLAVDRDGNPTVVFIHEGKIKIARSTDRGKTFSEPVVAIDAEGKAAGFGLRGPRIAVDRNRRIFVTAFLPLNKKAIEGTAAFVHVNDLFFAVSTDKGETFSDPVMVNDKETTARRSLHNIAVTPSGDLHVVWLDDREGKGPAIHSAKVGYRTKKPPKSKLLVPNACELCAPALALGSGSVPILVYREGGKKKDRRVLIGKTSGKTRRRLFQKKEEVVPSGYNPITDIPSGISNCPQDSPAIAVSPDFSRIAVAWMDPRDRTDGENVHWTIGRLGKFPREFYTHSLRRFYQGKPTVVFDDKGTAWCAWEDGRTEIQTIFAVRSDRASNDFAVSTLEEGRGGAPCLAAGGGVVALVYQADDDVHFRVLAAPE